MEHRSRHARLVREDLRPVLPDRAVAHRRCLRLLAVEQEAVRPRRRDHPPRRGQAMAVEERDPQTGYLTTGHEWNGIKELNTPVPRVVYFFLIVTALFAVGYWVLMPAWPLGVDLHQGPAGHRPAHHRHRSRSKQATLDRAAWTRSDRNARAIGDIKPIRSLMTTVRQTGRTLFGDNCAACHGRDAKGGKGFPNLTRRPGCGAAIRKRSPRPSASASIRAIRTAASRRCPPSAATGCCSAPRSRTSSPMSSRCPIRQQRARFRRQRSRPARRSSPPTAPPVTATTARASATSARPT